jgi:hypothetical protein
MTLNRLQFTHTSTQIAPAEKPMAFHLNFPP